MSGHGPNPILFNNKKVKIGRPKHSLIPHPPRPQHLIFALPPPSLKVDVICVKPLPNVALRQNYEF